MKKDVEFVTTEEMNGFVNDLFDGKPLAGPLDTKLPSIDDLDLGDKEVEYATNEEVRDFIVGLFKSKKS